MVVRLLTASILAQFVAALFIVPQTPTLLAFSVAVFAMGFGTFSAMARWGSRMSAPPGPACSSFGRMSQSA